MDENEKQDVDNTAEDRPVTLPERPHRVPDGYRPRAIGLVFGAYKRRLIELVDYNEENFRRGVGDVLQGRLSGPTPRDVDETAVALANAFNEGAFMGRTHEKGRALSESILKQEALEKQAIVEHEQKKLETATARGAKKTARGKGKNRK